MPATGIPTEAGERTRCADFPTCLGPKLLARPRTPEWVSDRSRHCTGMAHFLAQTQPERRRKRAEALKHPCRARSEEIAATGVRPAGGAPPVDTPDSACPRKMTEVGYAVVRSDEELGSTPGAGQWPDPGVAGSRVLSAKRCAPDRGEESA